MTLRKRMKADLTNAMKERARATVMTLRALLAAIDNAEAIPIQPNEYRNLTMGKSEDVARKVLTEEDIRNILQREADERRTAMGAYARLGKDEEAERLRAEVALIADYLGHGN